jgi:hypothetical protein
MLMFTAIIGLLISWMAYNGQLPGQTFSVERDADLGPPQIYVFRDKTNGVVVPVSLSSKTFPTGIPSQLNMQISISAELKKAWEIEPEVVGYIDEGGKQRKMATQPVVVSEVSDSARTTVLLDQLEKEQRYTLNIYLHGKGGDVPSKEDVMHAIVEIRDKDKKGMHVIFLTKAKK